MVVGRESDFGCAANASGRESEPPSIENISGSTLKPSSREWRDSLFELGMLLHETGQHEQSITVLEEAIERYPDDQQALLAQYLIGESYRHWAEDVLQRARSARTSSEREKNQQLADARLTTALDHFEEVQRDITLRTHDVHAEPQPVQADPGDGDRPGSPQGAG